MEVDDQGDRPQISGKEARKKTILYTTCDQII